MMFERAELEILPAGDRAVTAQLRCVDCSALLESYGAQGRMVIDYDRLVWLVDQHRANGHRPVTS